jgi:riboflavin transporter FmnP
MPNLNRNSSFDVGRLVGMATFAALAYGVTFVFRIPVSFLTFDAKDAVLTVAAFIYGPVSAIIMSLIPALIEFITISSTGFWGFLMNFASSACFSFCAALIYKFKRSLNGAIAGLYTAVILTTGLMMLLNMLITPIYMDVPRKVVVEMIPTLLMPFNFAKALMNAALTMIVYKPVSVALKRAGLVRGGTAELRFNRQSVIMLVFGAVTLAAAITIFVILKMK